MPISPEISLIIQKAISPDDVVIVAPLNWGLGHASRSAVIIEFLNTYCAKVIICSDGVSGEWLQKEFPTNPYHELPSPSIRYEFTSMFFNAVTQSSSIYNHINIDRKAAQSIAKLEKATVILSDNRFGFRSDKCKNIYMTHQLNIMSGWLSPFLSIWHRSMIKKFDSCWVPDYQDDQKSNAGMLSRNNHLSNVEYIGPLTRIQGLQLKKTFEILIFLSGPEPQRSFLEHALIHALGNKTNVLLIRGSIQKNTSIAIPPDWDVIDIAIRDQVEKALNSAKKIICRSGYSTIMDLTSVSGAEVVLIPTPGQGEQEYLAQFHKNKYRTIIQADLENKKETHSTL